MKKEISIALDFDGTVVKHRYPSIGEEIDNCSQILKRWVDEYNVIIILDTMRSGSQLTEALQWFADRGVKITSIGYHPTQRNWTDSPKAYAIFSIDDRNVGGPIKYDEENRAMVDWEKICEILEPIIIENNEK